MATLKFGMIGTNFISKNFVEAEKLVDETEITVLYTRTACNRNQLNYNHEVEVITDFEDFIDSNVDVVYIASPNSYHQPQAIRLMNSGKHVLCEKPLASNVREVELMIKAAKANRVVLLEAMRPLFHPSFRVIKEGLEKIGKLHIADLKFCQYSSRYDAYKQSEIKNAFDKTLSNGAIMDIGIYPIEIMVALFGVPEKVSASGYILPKSIDGYGHIVATYEDKCCQITYSKISNSYLPSEFQGEDGVLLVDKIACPSKVWIKWRDGSEELLFDKEIPLDMRFEIMALVQSINGKLDVDLYNKISLESIKITDEVRRQLGIVFPSDEKVK